MVGRLDDWLKVVMEKNNLAIDPGYLEWAGVAVFKKTYRVFQERSYRLRLLSAAFRNHMHWSEFIGGDVVISPLIRGKFGLTVAMLRSGRESISRSRTL
jgi:transaldolase